MRRPEISPTSSNIVGTPSIISEVAPTQAQGGSTKLEMVSICPATRITSLANLGLPKRLNLVAIEPTADRHGSYDTGFYLIDLSTTEPREIDVTPPSGMINYNYEVSPDNQWVSFIRWSKTNLKDRSLWITSLDGNKQWVVKKFTDTYTYSRWISANELVIIGPQVSEQKEDSQLSLPFYYYMPLTVVNPFTLDEEILSPLPSEYIDQYQEQMFTFRTETVFDLFRLMFGESYALYNYAERSSHFVFTWLQGSNSTATKVFRKGDLFVVTVTQPYGFDISNELNLSEIEQLHEYDSSMRKIIVPTTSMPIEILQLMPETDSLILYQKTESFAPTNWYIFNYEKMKFVNYCYESAWDVSVYPSPDGNFLAFSRGYPEYPDGEIAILNLSTGYVSTIEGFQMVGWGIQQ